MTAPFENLSLQDIEGEIWKDIKDLEGYYQVSNFGRVKRLEREMFNQNRNIKLPCRIRKLYKNKRGKNKITTLVFIASIDKIKYFFFVKRLVMDAFGKKEVSHKRNWIFHKDMDWTNNHIGNLFYGDEEDISNIVHKRSEERGKLSKYRGVSKNNNGIYGMSIVINKRRITKGFKNELEAAKKYDYYIKKYNLKRKGNFINNTIG